MAAASADGVSAPRRLRVTVFPGGANLPLWVAEELGFFAREGLAVELTPTPNSVALVTSLMDGRQDIALAAFDNVVAYREGQGEIALAGEPDLFAFMGFSHGTVRLVAARGIQRYDDLRGRTLAVDAIATGYSLVLRKLLQLGGLAETDYTLESVGGTAARARALMEGNTAATLLTTPLELAPEARGCVRLANVIDVLGPYQTIVGVARRSWASAHRRELTGFIRAATAALDRTRAPRRRAEAVAIYRKYLPDTPEEAAAAAVEALANEREGLASGGWIDPEGVATVLAIRAELGRPRKELGDAARYLDESYLREALGEPGRAGSVAPAQETP